MEEHTKGPKAQGAQGSYSCHIIWLLYSYSFDECLRLTLHVGIVAHVTKGRLLLHMLTQMGQPCTIKVHSQDLVVHLQNHPYESRNESFQRHSLRKLAAGCATQVKWYSTALLELRKGPASSNNSSANCPRPPSSPSYTGCSYLFAMVS